MKAPALIHSWHYFVDAIAVVQLCVKEWQLEDKAPVRALALAAASPRRLGLPRLGSTSPLIYVSSGSKEISLWDVGNARCHQVLSHSLEVLSNIAAL